MEFLRIWNMVKDILYMHEKDELSVIIEKLLDPTWIATGLKFDTETLVFSFTTNSTIFQFIYISCFPFSFRHCFLFYMLIDYYK